MNNAAISLQNITFRYLSADHDSLNKLNISVWQGECVLLCGDSGCGKTTVTRLVNGLIPNYYEGELSGDAIVMGRSVVETPIEDISEYVGSIFQNPRSQFFCVDTESEIAFACENCGIPEEEICTRMKNTISRMNLQPLVGRSIFDLSGGEKQKIACAGVDCLQPQIIVMDEPTSNLDLDSINELRNTISEWKSHGKTILIAEHRLGWLAGLCDRVIIMNKGSVAIEYTGNDFFSIPSDVLNQMGLRSLNGFENQLLSPVGLHSLTADFKNKNQMLLEKFNYHYLKKQVLDIEQLSIPMGSVVAVTGHNGAGKTTFVKCLCGLQKHFKGTVLIDGKQYHSRQMRKLCYMVMQDVNHQLFAESVLEEIMLGMQQEDKQTALEMLKKLDLLRFSERHPMSLSGGQKQRTAIASALLAEKKILIFDEPTSGLDFRHMVETASLFRSLSKDVTVFIVTHDMELIERCCTHILHIESGKITENNISVQADN